MIIAAMVVVDDSGHGPSWLARRTSDEALRAPWRLEYIQSAEEEEGCLFCPQPEGRRRGGARRPPRAGAIVLLRNKFPYSSGHLMVAPPRHAGEFGELSDEEVAEVDSSRSQGIARCTDVRPAGVQPRLEPWAGSGRWRRRPRPPPRRAPLGRRHELHAGAGRRKSDPRAPPWERRRLAENWLA